MVETKVEIRFLGPDETRAAIESTAESAAEEQAELVLFCHYTVHVLRKLARGESASAFVQALVELEDASDADVVRRAAGGGAAADRARALEGTRRTVRVLVVQRLLSARRGPRILLSVRARRFRLGRRDLHHALERSVLAILASLLERRAGDTAYTRRLTRAGGLIGRLAQADPAVLANEVGAALAAADLAWHDGSERALNATENEIRCPACGESAASVSGDRSFEERLWPDSGATLAKCGHCASGIWVRDGATRAIAPDAWRAMESMRSWLVDEAEDEQEASLFDALKGVFAGEGWSFSEVDPMPVLLTELNGPSGTWKLYAHAIEERQLILFYSICPLVVPPEKRGEMASFLARANYGLAVGNFELDFADGEIRYKTSLNIEDGRVSPALVRRLAKVNAVAMERYLPSIAAVITGTPALPGLEEQRGS
jgi:hypothetical protein